MAQTEVTTISQEDYSQIFSGKVDSILTPNEDKKEDKVEKQEEKKQEAFKRVVDTEFKWTDLANLGDDNTEEKTDDTNLEKQEEHKSEEKKTPGRKAADLVSLVNELVESGELFPFEDGAPKTIEEAKELIKLNIAENKKSTIDTVWKEKVETYSPQIQAILHYAEQGGTDVTPLIAAISEVERTGNLDIETEEGQENIISEYLKVSGWPEEDIKEEIETAKDLGKLKSKAEKFLPKISQMNEQRIQLLMQEQTQREQQADEARKKYLGTIKTTLDKEKLGDVKLTRQDKALIWEGLTDVRHKSWSGQPTNLFFKRLEEMQAGDKVDYDHFLEIVYHTLNRGAFKDKLREELKTIEAADTVRKLKTQDRKANTQETLYEEEPRRNTIQRVGFKNPWG